MVEKGFIYPEVRNDDGAEGAPRSRVFVATGCRGLGRWKLDQEEADAIVRTALEEGLELDEIAEIEEATKNPIDIGVVDQQALSRRTACSRPRRRRLDRAPRRRGDGRRERRLKKLGGSLKVPDKPREIAPGLRSLQTSLPRRRRSPPPLYLGALRRIIGDHLPAPLRPSAKAKTPKFRSLSKPRTVLLRLALLSPRSTGADARTTWRDTSRVRLPPA